MPSARSKLRLRVKIIYTGKAAAMIVAAFLFLAPASSQALIGTGWGQVSAFDSDHAPLPRDVVEAITPQIFGNRTCEMVGDAVRLDNRPAEGENAQHYIVYSSCAGSAATALWVVERRPDASRIILSDSGLYVRAAGVSRHNGLRDLRLVTRHIHYAIVGEWHYDGKAYQKVEDSYFDEEDCNDMAKRSDPDFLWDCRE